MRKKLICVGAVVLVLALLLTLAPACGKEKEEATPTPGITPTPGVTPTPTPEAKTLKIGVLLPLSGPAAPWGVTNEVGVKWGVDKVNAAGGIKVGADRYMIEFTSCDSKALGSAAAKCASEFIDEGIKYVIGPIVTQTAVLPLFNEAKVINIEMDASIAIGPDWPYQFGGGTCYEYWLDMFFASSVKYHPELKSIAFIYPGTAGAEGGAAVRRVVVPRHGITIVDDIRYELGVTDFYPILLGILAKNPDGIDVFGAPGDMAMVTKQARELGYRGLMVLSDSMPTATLLEIAGPSHTWGILNADPDWTSPAYSQHARDLYQEWYDEYRMPGEVSMNICTRNGYGAVMFIQAAIERAGSIDPDDVLRMVDTDPDFTFDNFFVEAVKVCGLEYYGIKRQLPQGVAYGEIVDAEHINLSTEVSLVEPR